MLKVGITGGIGAGKSIVSSILCQWGIPVFVADKEAKKIIENNQSVQKQLRNTFGNEVLKNSGQLNQLMLSDIIFNDNKALKQINSIIHPYVRKSFLQWVEQQNAPYILEEAAILFESGSYKIMDKIIMVYSDKEIRIKRIIKRNGFSREKIENIIQNQMSDEEKCKKADYVIYNNEKTLLLPQILKIHNELISQ